uniref:Large protein n=1 Tax=Lentinula edodes negative-strand RNA virus 3 TaxID=2778987 RepID=A0A7S7C4H5_9VIRU|nr:large protein [Lentinula edodes negative-strand RNA virus 3]
MTSIKDLIGNVMPNDILEPQIYKVSNYRRVACEVFLSGTSIIVTTENLMECDEQYEGHRWEFDIGGQDIIKIRHEITSNMMTEDTDVKFSEIDPNFSEESREPFHNMSPDYFDPTCRRIGELGTSNSDLESTLRKRYSEKFSKYSPYLKRCEIEEYFIFIVSPHSIISNYPLSQEAVDDITARCRLGLLAEAKISEKLGEDIFVGKEENERTRLVEQVFSSIKENTQLEDLFNYKHSEIFEWSNLKMSDSDKQRAQQILVTEFQKTQAPDTSTEMDLDKRIEEYRTKGLGCRPVNDKKRVCNYPFIISFRDNSEEYEPLQLIDDLNGTCPLGLSAVWDQCFSSKSNIPIEESVDEKLAKSLSPTDFNKHRIKRWHRFKVDFSQDQLLEINLSGLMAKAAKVHKSAVDSKNEYSHKGFDPDCYTDDIEEFMNSNSLTRQYVGFDFSKTHSGELLRMAKNIAHDGERSNFHDSFDIFDKLIGRSEMVCFADLISCMMEELAYCYKHYTNKDAFMYRYLRHYRVGMVVHNTGSHLFVSFCYDRSSSQVIDTGRLGPEIFTKGNLFVSDWCSFTPGVIEHTMKAGPYIGGLLAHVMASFNFDPFMSTTSEFFNFEENTQIWQSMKSILLTFLNGKLDVEELQTSLRYFYVKQLDEFNPAPMFFVDRFPEVLRSRLTAYYLKRVRTLMKHYTRTRISREEVSNSDHTHTVNYKNILSVHCDGFISMEQLIDSFYYGYVVNKNRDQGVHTSFAICKKLMKEEFNFQKLKSEGKKAVDYIDKPEKHRTDISMLKYFSISLRVLLEERLGSDPDVVTKRDILREMAFNSFSSLATLKASSRNHDEPVIVDSNSIDNLENVGKARKILRDRYKSEYQKRPKMIQRMNEQADKFKAEKGRYPNSLIELVHPALIRLEKKGGFDSDLFAKSQHGGNREIHVLEDDARIVQFHIECISRVICKYFQSETITHPKFKNRFVADHYKSASIDYQDFITYGKSADASTWAQSHFVSRFAVMLISVTDKVFHEFIFRTLRLWVNKRVSLPMDLILTFIMNNRSPSNNELYNKLREAMTDGKLPFTARNTNKVTVESGMFQGLLHYTSSLYHTMIQEQMARLEKTISVNVFGVNCKITKTQGSDDSGSLNSYEVRDRRNKQKIAIMGYKMMKWKEGVAAWMGIQNSVKSLLAAVDFIEYNSEFFIKQKIVKPTFRWSSACLETSLVESFITRYRIFSNTLTQTLEGGASTFECAITQICQAWFHYKLLGADSSPLFKIYKEKLIEYPSPALGFFPLDQDLNAGMCGFDYSVFLLCKNSNMGTKLITISQIADVPELDYAGKKGTEVQKSSSDVKLKFTKDNIWKALVDSMNIQNIDECVEEIEKDPLIVFGRGIGWEDERITIALKMYSPGVKASLSTSGSVLKMQIASAYLLSCNCMSVRNETGGIHKMSLLAAFDLISNREVTVRSLDEIFPLSIQYNEICNYTMTMYRSLFLTNADFTRRSKVSVSIFETMVEEDNSVLDMCKRKWFGLKSVSMGRTHFDKTWIIYKDKYKFLRDTLAETKEVTELDTLHLKYFLEGISSKSRKITLSDSTAKHGSIKTVMTRLYWPMIKIMSANFAEYGSEVDSLRNALYCNNNFIFTDSHQNYIAQAIIKSSKLLSEETSSHDPRLNSLKIFRQVMDGEDKDVVVQKMLALRKSTLGYFSMRQQFQPGTNKRIGQGEWIGVVGSTSVRIRINGEYCSRIEISNVTDMDYLGVALYKLLNDIHVKPGMALLSPNNLYLNDVGRFTNSVKSDRTLYTITVNKDLKVNYLDKVSSQNWYIRTTQYNIRLVSVLDGNNEVTLLSEPLTARDWSPELNVLDHYSYDDLFVAYSKGSMASSEEWSKFFKSYFPSQLSERNKVYTDPRHPIHDLFSSSKLRNMLIKRKAFLSRKDDRDTYEVVKMANNSIEFQNVDMTAGMNLIENLFVTTGSFSVDHVRSAMMDLGGGDLQDLQENTLNAGGMIGALDPDVIQEIVDRITLERMTQEQVSEMYEITRVGMPASNKWLDRIFYFLAEALPEASISNFSELDYLVEIDSPYGNILSYAYQKEMEKAGEFERYVKPDLEDSEEGTDAEEMSTHMSEVSKKTEKSIMKRIELLNDTIAHGNIEARALAIREATKANKQLAVYKLTKGHNMRYGDNIGDIRMRDFMFAFGKYRSSLGIDDFGLEEIMVVDRNFVDIHAVKTVLMIQMKMKMKKSITDIYNAKIIDDVLYKIYTDSLYSTNLSEQFLDALCTLIGIEIDFIKGGQTIYISKMPFVINGEDGQPVVPDGVIYDMDENVMKFKI